MGNNKGRLYLLYRYLYQNTDESHPASRRQIMNAVLGSEDTYTRNTVTSDIKELRDLGFDIPQIPDGTYLYYYLASREFEPEEIRLLMDAVSASKFITEKQSKILINKLRDFTSKYQAEKLTGNLYCSDIKPTNSSAFYDVGAINNAINEKKRIQFHYLEYSPDKKKHARRSGKLYENSPYGLVWDNDHYYMVGWSDEHEKIVQFRVDRMKDTEVIDATAKRTRGFKMKDYVRENFQMYSGEREEVKLQCDNALMNAVIDKFGENVKTSRETDDAFIAEVTVSQTPTFYAWIFEFGGRIKIVSPDSVKEGFQKILLGQLGSC